MKNPSRSITVFDAMKHGKEMLRNAGIDGYGLDAVVLLTHATGRTKENLLAFDDCVLTDIESVNYDICLKKRAANIPVQYVTNTVEFMGIVFYVDENVLIPRADTEVVVEKVIEIAEKLDSLRLLDLCSGSGCIAISTAQYVRHTTQVIGLDISSKAVDIAVRNAESAGVSEKCRFYTSNLFDELENSEKFDNNATFDIIVSNPPYIPDGDIDSLMPSVRDYEPEIALKGGESGLDFYEKISAKAGDYIAKNGYLIFEIGHNQAKAITAIMKKNSFKNIEVIKDLAGHDRCLTGIRV